MQKFKEFKTRLGKFITNDLNGELINSSKHESVYYRLPISQLKVRISDHLSYSSEQDQLDIVYPSGSTKICIMHYKSMVWCPKTLTEVKNIMSSIQLVYNRLDKKEIIKETVRETIVEVKEGTIDISQFTKNQQDTIKGFIKQNNKS